MKLNLDLAQRTVLVVGEARAARHSIARAEAAGASVRLVSPTVGALASGLTLDSRLTLVNWPRSHDGWHELLRTVDLVVLVDVSAAISSLIERLSAPLRVWVTSEPPAAVSAVGQVTLVGGGPGDEQLLTVGALTALRSADIVYYDRLGPHDRLEQWSPGAEHVNVGKFPGHHAVPQADIERMLVASALAGKTVVRLKGGDPYVFGRGGEEVIACRAAGVAVSVISGVSSALAAPAIAGIPVTHRELSRMFTVVSGHAPFSENELAHLVGLGGTIVVLMGVATLPQLCAGLARHGIAPDLPVAIIERAFTDSQRTTTAAISTIVERSSLAGIRSPAVIVIGEVVRLAHDADVEAVALLQDAARMAR